MIIIDQFRKLQNKKFIKSEIEKKIGISSKRYSQLLKNFRSIGKRSRGRKRIMYKSFYSNAVGIDH